MELAVRHQTTYRYATPANQVSLLLRLYPSLLDCQRARSWEVTVNGTPVTEFPLNAFGDGEGFYHRRGTFSEMEIVATGTVETQERHGIVSGFLQEMISGFKLLGMVIGPVLNAGESLKKMFDGFGEGGATKGVNILGDALKALLSPVTSIFEGLDDIGRWLSGKASGLGYIFAKDQNAYLAAAKRGAKFTLGGEEEKRLPNGDKNFHGVNATSYWKDVKSVATSRAWDVRSAIAPAGAEWDLTPEGQQRSSWGTSAFRVPLQHPTGDMVMSHADQALASYAPSLPPSQSTYAPEVTSTINLTVNGTGPVDAEQISKQVGEEVDTRLANLMRDSGELVQ